MANPMNADELPIVARDLAMCGLAMTPDRAALSSSDSTSAVKNFDLQRLVRLAYYL